MADEWMKVKFGDRSRLKGRVEGVQPPQKQISLFPSRDRLVVQTVIASRAKQSHYCF